MSEDIQNNELEVDATESPKETFMQRAYGAYSRLKTERWVFEVLLLIVLLVGAYLRLTGLDWDADQHLHPDERFLTGVETALRPVESLKDYWDTANSSMNPNNVGYSFFVYGTLPIFVVRYMGEWLAQTGFGEINLVGRQLSAMADLMVIVFVYLTATRVYNKKVGLAAATFSAFTVLQIQLSHFFAVDTYLNLFTMMSVYFAIRVATDKGEKYRILKPLIEGDEPTVITMPKFFIWDFVLFGAALGMAMASKVNALPVAMTLPLAVFVRFARIKIMQRKEGDSFEIIRQGILFLFIGGFLSLVAFRIFQPYAFTGPNFIPSFSEIQFGIEGSPWYDAIINPAWRGTMESLFAQQTGDIDWPPSLQWARRPVWFSVQNMVIFGFGIPLGLLAWFGFGWVGWKMITEKNAWQKHIVIWVWVAFYFTWQSSAFNPTMRYQLPIYPMLTLYAGWAFVALWDWGARQAAHAGWRRWLKPVIRGLSVLVMLFTIAYAFAFVQIYRQPVSRVAATDWIYENIPGPLTLNIETENGETHQPLSIPYDMPIRPDFPYTAQFTSHKTGALTSVSLKHVIVAGEARTIFLTIYDLNVPEIALYNMPLDIRFNEDTGFDPQSISFVPNTPIILDPAKSYRVLLELSPGPSEYTLAGVELRTLTAAGESVPVSLHDGEFVLAQTQSLDVNFTVESSTTIIELYTVLFPGTFEVANTQTLKLEVSDNPSFETILATAELTVNVGEDANRVFELDNPVELVETNTYYYRLTNLTATGGISLSGTAITHETSWDDGLPLRHDGYDGYGGIYQRDFNLDLYADDNEGKRIHMLELLEGAEYITISSSRVWGSVQQVYERYPMTIEYYHWLLGCPADKDLEWCYNVADVDTFEEQLGFDLIQVYQSGPTLGPFRINDQFAEEAFTVYDHPKVFIFQKTEDYDHAQVTQMLESVDLSGVFHVTPMQAGNLEFADLMLPQDQLETQRAGGTWSDLFNVDSLLNTSQPVAVVVWYLAVALLGIATYPLLRRLMAGLDDKGYPLARTSGLLLLSYLSWLAGSVGLGYERWVIALLYALLVGGGITMAFFQWDEIKAEIKEKGTYFLLIEALFLLFFLLYLFVRFANPDLWHPSKGGEKPMDFSYFNAVLKSSSFPPYDPWYAGGYINYYYYGFVFAGTLVKMIGIMPSLAYNLVLPTMFALLAMGAFSATWNLFIAATATPEDKTEEELDAGTEELLAHKTKRGWLPWLVGLAGALGVAMLGNLGTLRMFWQGFQKLGAYGVYDEAAPFFVKMGWLVQGFGELMNGNRLPYGTADWYWNPSRAIAALNETQPITEFPWFTMLYADPHAHLFSLSITVLVIGWVIAVLLGKAWKGQPAWVMPVGIIFGGLSIGALYGTNTWDYPTYLALGVVVLGYAMLRFRNLDAIRNFVAHVASQESKQVVDSEDGQEPESVKETWREKVTAMQQKLALALKKVLDEDDSSFKIWALRMGAAVLTIGLLAMLTRLLYAPYNNWYVAGYTEITQWTGTHTAIKDYLVHWGLFLFVIFFWLGWETIDWMAKTPASALRKFAGADLMLPVAGLLFGLSVMFGLHVVYEVRIHWIALLMAAWAAALLFRPSQPESKRLMLFFIGTSLFLTVMVEVIVLSGDIARMNTVFKFYLQVWVMFGVSAAAGMGIIWKQVERWTFSWQLIWQLGFTVLAASAALFPMIATSAKMQDRMSEDAPNTLDGMAYMESAFYHDQGVNMELAQDYDAIRWMQDNVIGSPVLVEAQIGEYRWGSRFAVYTGLPSVLGWRWHQMQQRVPSPDSWIPARADGILNFYLTTNIDEALTFLATYDVSYIVVGQLERAYYPGVGLSKFEQFDGEYWQVVYEDRDTVIYEVIADAILNE